MTELKENHLTRLRHLTIMFHVVKTLLFGVWKTVGSTVEKLVVLKVSEYDDTRVDNYKFLALKDFKRYCRNISKLRFEVTPAEVRCDLLVVFVLYRKQILNLYHLGCGLGTEDLREIRSSCPIVSITISDFGGCCVDDLIVLGKNASLVNLGSNTFSKFDKFVLREVARLIVNLTRFCVSGYSSKLVEGINEVFRVPRSELMFVRNGKSEHKSL